MCGFATGANLLGPFVTTWKQTDTYHRGAPYSAGRGDRGSRIGRSITMSTTTQHQPSEQPVHPDRVFDRLVWNNVETCRNCFRRVKVVTPAAELWGTTDARVEDHHDRTPDATLAHDKQEHDEYGELATYPLRTTCEGCGSVGCHGAEHTLSIDEALERTDRLADRLEEQGHTVDRALLRTVVEKAKRREDLAGRDYDIFREATAAVVRR